MSFLNWDLKFLFLATDKSFLSNNSKIKFPGNGTRWVYKYLKIYFENDFLQNQHVHANHIWIYRYYRYKALLKKTYSAQKFKKSLLGNSSKDIRNTSISIIELYVIVLIFENIFIFWYSTKMRFCFVLETVHDTRQGVAWYQD